MNSILCAIDFSEQSNRCVTWASDLAERLGSDVELIHTYRLNLPEIDTNILEYKRKVEQAAKDKFKLIETSASQSRSTRLSFHVEVGYLNDRIRERLRRTRYEMIVVPSEMSAQLFVGGLNRDVQSLVAEFGVPLLFYT